MGDCLTAPSVRSRLLSGLLPLVNDPSRAQQGCQNSNDSSCAGVASQHRQHMARDVNGFPPRCGYLRAPSVETDNHPKSPKFPLATWIAGHPG